MKNLDSIIITVAIGAPGTVKNNSNESIKKIPGYPISFEMQIIVLMVITQILQ